MNTLHIIGNLTNDPECRTIQGEKGPQTVCNLTVAVNRIVRGQRTAEYFRIALWNKQAENAAKYLSKGRLVAVRGPVVGRAYRGQDGQERCSLEIQEVEEIEYLGGRGGNEPHLPGTQTENQMTPADDDECPF